jgi:hypothetical protein
MTSSHAERDNAGLLTALIDDGRPLLTFTAIVLILVGLFALFLSATRHFLPHDVAYLGMTAETLCSINECRIVHFMLHDRVSFGGSLIGIGILYLWLIAFPLRQYRPWAWWLLAISGFFGFGSFLLYLGYGYLDTWHGAATLLILPCFGWGLLQTYSTLQSPKKLSTLWQPCEPIQWSASFGLGRLCLLATAGGLTLGGLIIMSVGITTVFVPQDLEFMDLTVSQLNQIHPRLVPLIAHDRAGFGGGVCCCGLTMFFCVWCGQASRSLWQALLATGIVGFGTAIGIHPIIGYTDFFHLAPAYTGATLFLIGICLSYGHMHKGCSNTIP